MAQVFLISSFQLLFGWTSINHFIQMHPYGLSRSWSSWKDNTKQLVFFYSCLTYSSSHALKLHTLKPTSISHNVKGCFALLYTDIWQRHLPLGKEDVKQTPQNFIITQEYSQIALVSRIQYTPKHNCRFREQENTSMIHMVQIWYIVW